MPVKKDEKFKVDVVNFASQKGISLKRTLKQYGVPEKEIDVWKKNPKLQRKAALYSNRAKEFSHERALEMLGDTVETAYLEFDRMKGMEKIKFMGILKELVDKEILLRPSNTKMSEKEEDLIQSILNKYASKGNNAQA